MAARGGGRGGRGGWRGRGGRGSGAPGLKDDDGNFVPTEANEGPPPLFPKLDLPHELQQPDYVDSLLQLRRSDLHRAYKGSPYFMDEPPGQQQAGEAAAAAGGAGAGEVERYADRRNRKAPAPPKAPLASLLTLHPHHFPEELFSDRDRRLAAKGGRALLRRVPPASNAGAALSRRLEAANRLEALQARGGAPAGPAATPGDAAGAGAGAGAGEPEDEAPPLEADEDDDAEMEQDDYYQGEYFDDDEGYDDAYDDAGDEGPVY